jgi:hypothetical protein
MVDPYRQPISNPIIPLAPDMTPGKVSRRKSLFRSDMARMMESHPLYQHWATIEIYGYRAFTFCNICNVRSHWLYEFVRDTLADRSPLAIEPPVRRTQVPVDTEHFHDLHNFTYMPKVETEKSWVVRDLRQLLAFKNTEFIEI